MINTHDRPCIITNACKGCLTYMMRRNYFKSETVAQCSFTHNINDCPCIKCIIKIMCTDECEAFIEYKRKEL
jgi:hypothetical protein